MSLDGLNLEVHVFIGVSGVMVTVESTKVVNHKLLHDSFLKPLIDESTHVTGCSCLMIGDGSHALKIKPI